MLDGAARCHVAMEAPCYCYVGVLAHRRGEAFPFAHREAVSHSVAVRVAECAACRVDAP